MGATTADTQREIGALRADVTATVDELRSRVFGLARTVQGTPGEVRESAAATGQQAGERVQETIERVRTRPELLTVGAAVAVTAAGYAIYSVVDSWRESRKPRNKFKRQAESLGSEVWGRLEVARKQAERARKHGLAIQLLGEDEKGRAVRLTNVRLTDREGKELATTESDEESKGITLLKNLLWAALLSIVMAASGVLARRLAAQIWQATLRESPPTEK